MPTTRAQSVAAVQSNGAGSVPPFAAGKNKIINGDFNINQRAFSSTTGQGAFTFDRFKTARGGGTVTYSAQTFTLGTAPLSGYESTNFLRIDSTGQSSSSNYTSILQPIESVKTFAGQTITVSFWAKASSGTPKIGVAPEQRFGTGGSPSADLVTSFGDKTISTSWARYSFTGTIPSISGKTLGTAGDDKLIIAIYTSVGSGLTDYPTGVGLQTATIDIWGIQAEAGSAATPFTTATGTIQGELAACQRYYYKHTVTGNVATGAASGTAVAEAPLNFPVTMRIAPTITLAASGSGTGQIVFLNSSANYPGTIGTLTASRITPATFSISVTTATGAYTAGNSSLLFVTGTSQTVYEASAEL